MLGRRSCCTAASVYCNLLYHNFSNLHDHFITETGVGARNGIAHPAGAGALAALNFQSTQAYQTRDSSAYGLILTHVGYELGIKEQIENHVTGTLTGAPSVVAVNAANAAIAAANAANAAAIAAEPSILIFFQVLKS